MDKNTQIIGIGLLNNGMVIAPGRYMRRRLRAGDIIRLTFPDGALAGGHIQDYSGVMTALRAQCRAVTRPLQCRIALPGSQYLQQRIRLPDSGIAPSAVIPLIEAALIRMFPQHHHEMAYDYRRLHGEVVLTLMRRTLRDQWITLTTDAGLMLTALDIVPCALRGYAAAQGVSSGCWLIALHDNTLCWQAGVEFPALSGEIAVSEPALLPLLPLLQAQGFERGRHELYCLHPPDCLPEGWQQELHAAGGVTFADLPPGYAAAAGMALRREDRL